MTLPFLLREQAERKAAICVFGGIAPSEYEQLTMVEIAAMAEAIRKKNGGNR